VGVPAIGHGVERLKAAAVIAFALLAAGCEPPLADDPRSAFFLNFEGPPPLPADFRGGSVPSSGHDVWFCFHSPTELKLRDADRWQSAEPADEVAAFNTLCDDPALKTPEKLRALRAADNGARSTYTRLLLHEPASGAYFVRTFRRVSSRD
jgi:hypothetical protein